MWPYEHSSRREVGLDSGYDVLAVFTEVVTLRLLATLLASELLAQVTRLKLKGP